MTLEEIIAKWNAAADEWNQWSELGTDEKEEYLSQNQTSQGGKPCDEDE